MSLMIELTPSEEARLAAAAEKIGLAPEALARKLVTAHLSPPAEHSQGEDPTLALFRQWEEEDAQLTPEEVAEENRQWEEFKRNINGERDRAGARRVF
jgi:hypothetical protein